MRERPRVFVDASHLIAVSNRSDVLHGRALLLDEQFARRGVAFVTTQAVLLEVASALARPPARRHAIHMLETILGHDATEVVPLSASLFDRGLALFRGRPDQSWSLTDCVSFVVMRDQGIDAALTHDRHFEQAGFRALLRG